LNKYHRFLISFTVAAALLGCLQKNIAPPAADDLANKPSMPPENPYRHVGVLKLIDAKREINDRACPSEKSDGASRLDDSNASESVNESQKYNSMVNIPSSIRNHVPLLYSIILWNELVENLKSGDIKR